MQQQFTKIEKHNAREAYKHAIKNSIRYHENRDILVEGIVKHEAPNWGNLVLKIIKH